MANTAVNRFGPAAPVVRRLSAAAAAAFLAVAMLWGTALAQDPLVPPEQQIEDLIVMAGTYQSCYFSVVAVSCFQLYSSTGIIATDYSQGNINAETALGALDQNSLLLTACLTTIERIREVTPEDDHALLTEIDRLTAILNAEHELILALNEVCYQPSDRAESAVEASRRRVEHALDAYVGETGIE